MKVTPINRPTVVHFIRWDIKSTRLAGILIALLVGSIFFILVPINIFIQGGVVYFGMRFWVTWAETGHLPGVFLPTYFQVRLKADGKGYS